MSRDFNINAYLQGARERQEREEEQDKNKVQFMKMEKPGRYNIRILPIGNREQNTWHKASFQHKIAVRQKDNAEYKKDGFILCWNWFLSPDEMRVSGKALFDRGKLTEEDYKKATKYGGCPYCKVTEFMYKKGFDKAKVGQFISRPGVAYNIVDRRDGIVKVWRSSATLFSTINGEVEEYQKRGKNILDVNIGYDSYLNASGPNGLGRRYDWRLITEPCPASLAPGSEVYDLMDIVAMSFRDYQKTINCIKDTILTDLDNAGFDWASIGDDTSMAFAESQKGMPSVRTEVPPKTMEPIQVPDIFKTKKDDIPF